MSWCTRERETRAQDRAPRQRGPHHFQLIVLMKMHDLHCTFPTDRADRCAILLHTTLWNRSNKLLSILLYARGWHCSHDLYRGVSSFCSVTAWVVQDGTLLPILAQN